LPGRGTNIPPGRRVNNEKAGCRVVWSAGSGGRARGSNAVGSHLGAPETRWGDGWAYAEVGVKYDPTHPYTRYEITYRYGDGGLTDKGKERGYHAEVNKYWDSNGITVETVVKNSGDFVMEKVYASAGWPYI